MAKQGEYARIHRTVLEPEARAAQVPEDTHSVPLEMWVKGYLTLDAQLGDQAEVITRTGRRERGRLVEVNPAYRHDFGDFVPELLQIGDTLREILFGGEA